MGRVLSLDDAVRVRETARGAAKRVVFTNGCFDILHTGHLAILEGAKACGDLLFVGVNRDASVRGLKGPGRPIIPEDERAELLAALRVVDVAVLFAEPTPIETVLALRPDVLVKGGDYTPETIIGREEVESWGGRVVVIPLVEGRSTSGLVSEIQSRARAERP